MTTFGIRLAARLLHHLADEEAEQTLLAAAVGLDLAGVGGEDARRPAARAPSVSVIATSPRYASAREAGLALAATASSKRSRGSALRAPRRPSRARRVFAPAGIGWFMTKLTRLALGTPAATSARVDRIPVGRDERPGVVAARAPSREARDPCGRQLRQLAAQPLDERRLGHERDEVGLGEVAVVVRLLLRAVRGQRVGVRLVVVGAAARPPPRARTARSARGPPRRSRGR